MIPTLRRLPSVRVMVDMVAVAIIRFGGLLGRGDDGGNTGCEVEDSRSGRTSAATIIVHGVV